MGDYAGDGRTAVVGRGKDEKDHMSRNNGHGQVGLDLQLHQVITLTPHDTYYYAYQGLMLYSRMSN